MKSFHNKCIILVYYQIGLLNIYYCHIMYLCVYFSSTKEKFRDCQRRPEVSIPVFQLMKGKFESVNSTIFHVMQRMCFGFVQKLKKKKKRSQFNVCWKFKKNSFYVKFYCMLLYKCFFACLLNSVIDYQHFTIIMCMEVYSFYFNLFY